MSEACERWDSSKEIRGWRWGWEPHRSLKFWGPKNSKESLHGGGLDRFCVL